MSIHKSLQYIYQTLLCSILGFSSAYALETDVFVGASNSTLISNDEKIVLVDAQFKRSDALRLAAKIIETGKQLDTIYITHAHPDHVLGSAELLRLFPDAKLISRPEVVNAIEQHIVKRAKQLNSMMGANISAQFPIPALYTEANLSIDAEEIQIIDGLTGDSAYATAIFIPSSKTLIAGDLVFSGTHLWTATSNKETRAQWVKSLERLKQLSPETVIPGHQVENAANDVSAIDYTLSYLQAFEDALDNSSSADELVEKMKSAYPEAGGMFYLKTGVKKLLGGE